MVKAVPAINEPFVNSNGIITEVWYKYLLSLGLIVTPSEGGSDENEIPTMGKIFTSLLPITDDDNIHLLNGDLLSYSDEKYQNFIDYIATLVTDYPDLFCTEVEYQASISTYGICGKFVYDEENQTVRLPLTIKREIVAKKEPTNDDQSWYNLYSDGRVEQGGRQELTTTGTRLVNIILSIEMKDTNYLAFRQMEFTNSGNSYSPYNSGIWVATGYEKTTTGFYINSEGSNWGPAFSWEVKGYANTSLIPDIQFQTQYDYIIINDLTNITMQKYLNTAASRTIDKYVNDTSKPELDSYTDSKINEINQTANDVISRLLASDRNISFMKYEWDDKIRNDVSWLRADTFSWQDGVVYEGIYNHLVDDIDGKTLQSETVAGITIQYYLADDKHKICPASEESNVLSLYNTTGIAWYYILDTVNQRFKLPRTKWGFTGLRDEVGGYIEQQIKIPNHYHALSTMGNNQGNFVATNSSTSIDRADTTDIGVGYRYWNGSGSSGAFNADSSVFSGVIITTVAKEAVSKNGYEYGAYGNSTLVQPPATQMYLYCYAGDYTHTAIENTAGLNAELFNDKADRNLSNISATSGLRRLVEIYNNGRDWYKVYDEYDPSDGSFVGKYCEQGGYVSANNSREISAKVTLIKTMTDTNYDVRLCPNTTYRTDSSAWNISIGYHILSTSEVVINSYGIANSDLQDGLSWEVKGYIQE